MNVSEIDVTEITVARQIAATPEAVYDVWFDPANDASIWYGAKQLILEPAENKLFYWVTEWEGVVSRTYGLFTKLVRGSLIEHTWVGQGTHGLESTVSVSLTGKDGGTYVKLTHSGVPDDEVGRMAEYGWTAVITDIMNFFEPKITAN